MSIGRSIDFVIKQERRLCIVGDELGYFQCWDDTMPGGVQAVVEFPDCVRNVSLSDIAFCDEISVNLRALNEHHKMEAMLISAE